MDLLPFLGQNGTRRGPTLPFSNLDYELYQGDSLLNSGAFPYKEDDGQISIPIEQPGEHTLVFTFDDYIMEQTQGRTVVTAKLGVNNEDPDPPYVTHLTVRANGAPVEYFFGPGCEIEFTAYDDGSGIDAVSAWYKSFGETRQILVAAEGDGKFSLQSPNGISAGSNTDLTIEIADQAGNTLKMSIRFPVDMQISPSDQRYLE